MRNSKFYLSGLLAVMLLAGCNSEEITPGTGENDSRVPLQVTSGIQTRAHDNVWDKDDEIGIFMLNGTATDTYINVPYSTTDNTGSGAFSPIHGGTTIYLPTDGSARDFISYYPYQQEMTGNIYTANLATQSVQKAIDFMLADKVTGKSRTDAKVAFNFKHKLSKVIIDIQPGKGLTADDLKGMTVKLTGQHTSGTFDVLTGTAFTLAEGTGDITLLTQEDGKHAEGIVFPSENYNGMSLTFHTTGMGDYEWPLSESQADPKQFVEGKKYQYTITVNRTEPDVTATITDWLPGNGYGETGSAE